MDPSNGFVKEVESGRQKIAHVQVRGVGIETVSSSLVRSMLQKAIRWCDWSLCEVAIWIYWRFGFANAFFGVCATTALEDKPNSIQILNRIRTQKRAFIAAIGGSKTPKSTVWKSHPQSINFLIDLGKWMCAIPSNRTTALASFGSLVMYVAAIRDDDIKDCIGKSFKKHHKMTEEEESCVMDIGSLWNNTLFMWSTMSAIERKDTLRLLGASPFLLRDGQITKQPLLPVELIIAKHFPYELVLPEYTQPTTKTYVAPNAIDPIPPECNDHHVSGPRIAMSTMFETSFQTPVEHTDPRTTRLAAFGKMCYIALDNKLNIGKTDYLLNYIIAPTSVDCIDDDNPSSSSSSSSSSAIETTQQPPRGTKRSAADVTTTPPKRQKQKRTPIKLPPLIHNALAHGVIWLSQLPIRYGGKITGHLKGKITNGTWIKGPYSDQNDPEILAEISADELFGRPRQLTIKPGPENTWFLVGIDLTKPIESEKTSCKPLGDLVAHIAKPRTDYGDYYTSLSPADLQSRRLHKSPHADNIIAWLFVCDLLRRALGAKDAAARNIMINWHTGVVLPPIDITSLSRKEGSSFLQRISKASRDTLLDKWNKCPQIRKNVVDELEGILLRDPPQHILNSANFGGYLIHYIRHITSTNTYPLQKKE